MNIHLRLSSMIIAGGIAGVLASGLAPTAHAQPSGSATLDVVRARGLLACGVYGIVPGFSLPDSAGVMQGLDADGCRAIAAAVLGDATKVRFVPLTTTNRFTSLQSGEVDVLIHNTTWTLGREASQGLEFAGINFYDGAAFLVKTASGIKQASQLDGATICIPNGTSSEAAVADYFSFHNMKFTPVDIESEDQLQKGFLAGRCDVYSTDSSALASFRFHQGENAKDLTLLPEIFSKEPLGPAVRKGDEKWFDIVRWTQFAEVTAEEEGVDSRNVDSLLTSANPNIKRLLGTGGDMGTQLGLDKRWAYNIIKQVGNYGEIWTRDITPIGIPRGINNLWNRGGLQYAPPVR